MKKAAANLRQLFNLIKQGRGGSAPLVIANIRLTRKKG